MNDITYDIYVFTKRFLKLTKVRLSVKNGLILTIVILGLMSFIYLSYNLDKIGYNAFTISLVMMMLLALIGYMWHISDSRKTRENINFLARHSKRYSEFQNRFEEKYGAEYGQRLVTYLKSAEKELEEDIKREIEKSKYQLDKIVSLLTLTPLLTIFLSFGQDGKNGFRVSFVSSFLLVLLIVIILVCFCIDHIYAPTFSPLNDVANKQRVLLFLKGYLASGVFLDYAQQNVTHNPFYYSRRLKNDTQLYRRLRHYCDRGRSRWR